MAWTFASHRPHIHTHQHTFKMPSLTGRWTQILSSPRLCRSSHALSVVGSKAYLFGGEVLPRQPVDNHIDVLGVTTESQGMSCRIA
jgi:hypothetical protein